MSAISTRIDPNDFAYDYKPKKKEQKVVKHVTNYAKAKKTYKAPVTNKPNVDGTQIYVPEIVEDNIQTEVVVTPEIVEVPEAEKEIIVESIAIDGVEAVGTETETVEQNVVEDVPATPVVVEEQTLANTESDATFGTSMSVEPEEVKPSRRVRNTRVRSRIKLS